MKELYFQKLCFNCTLLYGCCTNILINLSYACVYVTIIVLYGCGSQPA